MSYAVVRIRGECKTNRDIKETMNLLNLTRVNHCVVVPKTPSVQGMLLKAKDYITWGEVDKATLAKLIILRGRLKEGNGRITDGYVKGNTKFNSVQTFSKAIITEGAKYKELDGVKPIFRLHPPKGGFKSVKRGFNDGGDLGYRGAEINKLLNRMLEMDVKSVTDKARRKKAAEKKKAKKAAKELAKRRALEEEEKKKQAKKPKKTFKRPAKKSVQKKVTPSPAPAPAQAVPATPSETAEPVEPVVPATSEEHATKPEAVAKPEGKPSAAPVKKTAKKPVRKVKRPVKKVKKEGDE